MVPLKKKTKKKNKKKTVCGRMRSSSGLQFLNVAKVPHQYRNLPFLFMESMLQGVSSTKSVWK